MAPVNPIKLVNVISTTVTKNGTKIEKSLAQLGSEGRVNAFPSCWTGCEKLGVTRLITYGEKSSMVKRFGIDQTAITRMPDGQRYQHYFSNGRMIKEFATTKGGKFTFCQSEDIGSTPKDVMKKFLGALENLKRAGIDIRKA